MDVRIREVTPADVNAWEPAIEDHIISEGWGIHLVEIDGHLVAAVDDIGNVSMAAAYANHNAGYVEILLDSVVFHLAEIKRRLDSPGRSHR
jgi:hypothetical protein